MKPLHKVHGALLNFSTYKSMSLVEYIWSTNKLDGCQGTGSFERDISCVPYVGQQLAYCKLIYKQSITSDTNVYTRCKIKSPRLNPQGLLYPHNVSMITSVLLICFIICKNPLPFFFVYQQKPQQLSCYFVLKYFAHAQF